MAIRTTDTAVQGIVEQDTSIPLTPFIETASLMVDDVAVASPAYTAARLELIERWLAAHFYKIRDQMVQNEQAKGVGQTFQYTLGLNLHVTTYGQQAMMLDPDGNLAALSKRMEKGIAKPGANWLGTGDSDGDDITT